MKPTKSKPRKGARALVLRGILIDHVKIDMDTRYLILPLSPEAQERRVEAGAKAIYNSSYHPEDENHFVLKLRKAIHGKAPTWEQLVKECGPNGIVGNCRAKARAVLAAIGDTPAGEGRGK